MTALSITSGRLSDMGTTRQRNTDYVGVLQSDDISRADGASRYAAAIADGTGELAGSDVASDLAVETFLDAIQGSRSEAPTKAFLESQVVRAFRQANATIYAMGRQHGASGAMATTLTGIVIAGDQLHIGHVGNTRAHLLRGDTIRRLTEDDSLVGHAEETKESEPRHAITRLLGTEADVPIQTYAEQLQAGDVVVLTTTACMGC